MIAGLNPMMCGNCGADRFTIYRQREDATRLFVECQGCKDVSVLVARATLAIDWGNQHGQKSEGRLTSACKE